MALPSVVTIASWPINSAKVCGRYLRASTRYASLFAGAGGSPRSKPGVSSAGYRESDIAALSRGSGGNCRRVGWAMGAGWRCGFCVRCPKGCPQAGPPRARDARKIRLRLGATAIETLFYDRRNGTRPRHSAHPAGGRRRRCETTAVSLQDLDAVGQLRRFVWGGGGLNWQTAPADYQQGYCLVQCRRASRRAQEVGRAVRWPKAKLARAVGTLTQMVKSRRACLIASARGAGEN